jgi:hypothetical protein
MSSCVVVVVVVVVCTLAGDPTKKKEVEEGDDESGGGTFAGVEGMGIEWSEPLEGGEDSDACCAKRDKGDPDEGDPTTKWGLLFA